MDTISLKAELLCMGLVADDTTLDLYRRQNPEQIWKTGNNGCFIEFDNTHLMASIQHKKNTASPYSFSLRESNLTQKSYIIKRNVKASVYPEWYGIKLSTGRMFAETLVLEGDRFFHLAYKGCDYMDCGQGCQFCATGIRNTDEATPLEIGEAAGIAREHIADAQVCLGGGTYLPISSNIKYFAECITEIRKRNKDMPIWIEMVPPNACDVDLLIEYGATAFGFNIEVWDDKKRKEYCPGKSRISKQHYIDILNYTAKLLPNRVGCCLIAGLDTSENIKEGIRCLTEIGVHPCILPFKPFDGSKLEEHDPCDPHELIELSCYAAEQMHEKGLDPYRNEGCLLCDCCTLTHDIWKKKYCKEVLK